MKVDPGTLQFDNIRDMTDIENDPEFIEMVSSLKSRADHEMSPLSEPPTVYKRDGKWYIKSGHRRVSAALSLGLTEIEVLQIKAPSSRSELIIDQLTDSNHRKDLSPIDRAKAIRELMAINGLSQKQAAESLGWSEGLVSQLLAILDLHPLLLSAIKSGQSHWRALYEARKLPIKDQEKWADALIHSARSELSVKAAIKGIGDTIVSLGKIRQLDLTEHEEEPDSDDVPVVDQRHEIEKDAHAQQRLAELQADNAQSIAEEAEIRLSHRLVKVSNDLLDEVVARLSEPKSPQDIVLAALKVYLKTLKEGQ